MTDGHSLDLPFEHNPPGQTIDEAFLVSSGVVVLAATVPVPDGGIMPALVFRFAKPDGSGFHPPLLLVTDDGQMAKLRPLIVEAVQAARRAATIARGKR